MPLQLARAPRRLQLRVRLKAARPRPFEAAVHNPVAQLIRTRKTRHDADDKLAGCAMILVRIKWRRREYPGGIQALDDGGKIALEINTGIGGAGRERLWVGHRGYSRVRRCVRYVEIVVQKFCNAAVRIAKKETLRRGNPQKLRDARCFLHAQLRKLHQSLRSRVPAALDNVGIELKSVAARDPHDRDARPRRVRALDRSGAAQRLVVRVRRDNDEHIIAREHAEFARFAWSAGREQQRCDEYPCCDVEAARMAGAHGNQRAPVSCLTSIFQGSRVLSLLQRLIRDAATLGVVVSGADAARLITLIEELARWNRTYNLTAIKDPEAMLTHHLLDSLAIHADVSGARVADVGTGAGFPGLPLALLQPARRFTLIDSNGKKVRFVAHAARTLGLKNVEALQARVETLRPEAPFDTVMARAFAPLPELLEKVAPLVGPGTRVLAMKGKQPDSEIEAVPRGWRLAASRELSVPGLDAARCLLRYELNAAAER
jgi:16S rRNA (guanine527-N7)-methyltransferase